MLKHIFSLRYGFAPNHRCTVFGTLGGRGPWGFDKIILRGYLGL